MTATLSATLAGTLAITHLVDRPGDVEKGKKRERERERERKEKNEREGPIYRTGGLDISRGRAR